MSTTKVHPAVEEAIAYLRARPREWVPSWQLSLVVQAHSSSLGSRLTEYATTHPELRTMRVTRRSRSWRWVPA